MLCPMAILSELAPSIKLHGLSEQLFDFTIQYGFVTIQRYEKYI